MLASASSRPSLPNSRRLSSIISTIGLTLLAGWLAGCGGGGGSATRDSIIRTGDSADTEQVEASAVLPDETSTPPSITPPVTRGGPLHQVDWAEYFRTSTDFDRTLSSDLPDEGYLDVKGVSGIGGIPLTDPDSIVYVDLDGDQRDEAVVLFASGGTAGATAGIVLAAGGAAVSGRAPKIVASFDGYKLQAENRGGQLIISQPIYVGWEPNCCPSGQHEGVQKLEGDHLVEVSGTDLGYPEAKVATVEHFYTLIASQSFDEAYEFVGPNFKRQNPFSSWTAGYATTLSVEAEVADAPNDRVKVVLDVSERDRNGRTALRQFSGTWQLTWDATTKPPRWIMDDPSFAESTVSSVATSSTSPGA